MCRKFFAEYLASEHSKLRRCGFHKFFEVLIVIILVRKNLCPLGLALTILFSATIIPVPSNAEWTKVVKNDNGNTVFVDFERIRKKNGYIFFWSLIDRQNANHLGYLSTQVYRQADCKMTRYKILKYTFHEKRMGNESGTSIDSIKPNWEFPSPLSEEELPLNVICSH